MGFDCLKATEPLREDSLLFTTKSPGASGTHLIDLGNMNTPGLGIQLLIVSYRFTHFIIVLHLISDSVI